MSDEGFEVVRIKIGELSTDPKAVSVCGCAHEVHGHVSDDGHVLRSRSGLQAHEVVVEDDIEDLVQAILDVPMGAHGGIEGPAIELGGGEIVASFTLCPSVALKLGLDQGDHRQMGHVRLVGIAAIRGEPGDVVADAEAAAFEATVVVDEGLVGVGDQVARIGEEADHVVVGGGPVAFDDEEIITAAGHDRLGDSGLCADGVNRDQRPLSSSRSKRRGIAVISLLLSSTASWPRTRRWRDV